MNRPVLTIVAGSNGCGKTSLTSLARTIFQEFPLLDPDAIAKSLQEATKSNASAIEAGRHVLLQAQQLLGDRQNFTVETTLSGQTYLNMAKYAKEIGYVIVLIFIGTTTVEINIQRVKDRVAKGGHNVPEPDQRRRYPRTLKNLRKLLPLADVAFFFDNSTDLGHVLVAVGRPDTFQWLETIPSWATDLRKSQPSGRGW